MSASASLRNVLSSSVEGHITTRCNGPSQSKDAAQGPKMAQEKRKGVEAKRGKVHTSSMVNQKATTSTQFGNSTEETKEETASSTDESPTRPPFPMPFPERTPLERLMESASQAVDTFVKSASAQSKKVGSFSFVSKQDEVVDSNATPRRTTDLISVFLDDACSPCSPSDFDTVEKTRRSSAGSTPRTVANDPIVDHLGIAPMVSPVQDDGAQEVRLSESVSTPASRRRQRYMEEQVRLSSINATDLAACNVPMQTLTVKNGDTIELEHSISELTMKSSHGEARSRLAENRRMAYYAVGKHHKNSGRGGNRRCYFTGKLILGGAPFYAGSVQQGLRTLVVFCLPSAIGLPKGVELRRLNSLESSFAAELGSLPDRSCDSVVTRESNYGVAAMPRILKPESLVKRSRSLGANSTTGSSSRISSLDDMSLSLEEDLDPNWGLDRDFLLTVLPEPSQDLLRDISNRYPEQFETLPIQVRSPHCWRLFIKFCFFSGLPIAEGELHYKVKDEVSSEVFGEEIILSHEVMEAVNGESAEILRLPNLKTFRYLRKHYTQQSGKLPDVVFKRTSWEVVLPEI